ncbi:hypothetical protein BKK56_03585 [Rodentibacter genomosp. 2]|nr:hypothetical protein BKK56_03585 [Rodentibacter genomosp. 2]
MYGCYPNPSLEHNRYLLRAIRDFVREDNPASLKYVGRCYKFPWLNPLIFLFNVGSIFRMPFNQKLADKQIEAELKAWKKRTENSKKTVVRLGTTPTTTRQSTTGGIKNG